MDCLSRKSDKTGKEYTQHHAIEIPTLASFAKPKAIPRAGPGPETVLAWSKWPG